MENTFEIPLVDDLLDNEDVEVITDPDFYKDGDVDSSTEKEDTIEEDSISSTEDVEDAEVEEEIAVNEDPTAVGTYKTLIDKGFISEREDWDGTFDKLDEIFDEIPENVKNDILSNTNPKGKQIMEFIMNKGHDLDDDDIQGFLNLYSQPTEVDSISAAKDIITAQLKSQGFDDDMIESNIDLLESKDYEGEALKELANKYVKGTAQDPDKVLEAQRQEQMELEAAQREFTNHLYDNIDNNKYPKRTKEAIKANYRSNAYVDRFTEAFTNPEALVQLITLSQYYDSKTKTFDLTEFAKVAASKQVEKLKDNSIRQNYSSTTQNGQKAKGKSSPMDDVQFVNP